MNLDLIELAVAGAIVTAAFFVFGISGFGSGLVAIPVLTHLWAVQFVLPVMMLLDLAASSSVSIQDRRHAAWHELARLTVPVAVGLAAGVLLLVSLPQQLTLGLLGAAVIAFGLLSLRQAGPSRTASALWSMPAGFLSGLASGLFGVGGAPAVIYLARRLHDKFVLRATLATMLVISVLIRAGMLAYAGLLGRREIMTALVLIPFAFAGLAAGTRVHLRLSRAQFARFVAMLVVAAGLSLVVRAAAG